MDVKKKKKATTRRTDGAHGKCLAPGCRKNEHARGLCEAHYKSALRCIQGGKATWAKLEQKGLAKKKRRAGRKPSNFVVSITS